MFLRRIHVRGFRAAAEMDLTCEFPGRFSLLVGEQPRGSRRSPTPCTSLTRGRSPNCRGRLSPSWVAPTRVRLMLSSTSPRAVTARALSELDYRVDDSSAGMDATT